MTVLRPLFKFWKIDFFLKKSQQKSRISSVKCVFMTPCGKLVRAIPFTLGKRKKTTKITYFQLKKAFS